jgi:hypothetical protein
MRARSVFLDLHNDTERKTSVEHQNTPKSFIHIHVILFSCVCFCSLTRNSSLIEPEQLARLFEYITQEAEEQDPKRKFK